MPRKKKPKFRSKLEAECWELLKKSKLHFEYEPWSVTLFDDFVADMDTFQRWGKKFKKANPIVRGPKYTPDFVGENWVIETKGYLHPRQALVWKLFRKWVHDNKKNWLLFMPHNKKEIKQCINIIKNNEAK